MNYCNNQRNDHCVDPSCGCQNQQPTIPQVPKDEEAGSIVVPQVANLINKRNTTIIPYSAEHYSGIYANLITGKAENLQTLAFGSYVNTIWFKETESIDSFEKEAYGTYSFALPENVFIENITAVLHNSYERDYGSAVLRAKVRMYRCDFDKNIFTYIKGTEVVFEPAMTGIIADRTTFRAKAKNLNILVEEDSKIAIGIFVEGENIENEHGIDVRVDAGVILSMRSEK